ncbi:hypothetical protein [Streptomyces lunaelactis]|uniref:hypothetical protein n=1 Tax=Streptomyces lunaelactis TaxID=1535768 RepID=UPI001584B219|nr:hypothetical protein [Streptomyces lunaelactis]NUK22438.1 hypothetical protein [Streptomyces lunaelactis]
MRARTEERPDVGEAAVPAAENTVPTPTPTPARGVVPGSVVPAWREGLEVSALSPDYQRITAVLIASRKALTCKELAAEFGVEPVAAKVEGLRWKANRLVRRGWLVKNPSGRFALTAGVRGGGS